MSTTKTSNQPKSRIPSRRDQEIFQRIVVRCEPQYKVAQDLGLSPGRISQIVARVRRWLAVGQTFLSAVSLSPNTGAALDAAFSALEQQRLQRQLAQSRHEYLYELAIHEIHRMSHNRKHTTIRVESKPSDGEADCQSAICHPQSAMENPKSEITKIVTTTRDQPLNVQLIKAAQRSTIELQKLADLDPLPPPEISRDADRRALAEDLVTELLDDAAASDKVRSVGWDTERPFVEDLFKFLLGERHRGLAVNVIAADAQHGRLRDDDHPYSGRDQMLVTSDSPLAGTKPGPGAESPPEDSMAEGAKGEALKNPKLPSEGVNQKSADRPHPLDAATQRQQSGCGEEQTSCPPAHPSKLPPEKPQNFSSVLPPITTVRLHCPVVINPP